MLIEVKAKAGSKNPGVSMLGAHKYEVRVSEQPEGGKANDAIMKALAGYLGIPVSYLKLRAGAASRKKLFELRG